MFTKTLSAAVTAAALTTSALTLGLAPVAADAGSRGQVSVSITPTNADEARMLRMGLAMYMLHQDVRANGHVTQRGVNNAAGIAQGGRNNQAIIHQQGCNHNGTISQQGNNNAYGLFQFGCNTSGHVSQVGNNNTGLTLQLGW